MRRIIFPWLFGSAYLSATIIKHEWPANTCTKSGSEPYQFGQRVVKPWDNEWDGEHTKDAIDSNPSLPRQSYSKLLIFVRHGQYNLKAATRDEKVLTSLGWKQAYESGRQLKRCGIKIDRIIHSDLIRARQTTAAILAGLQDDCDHLFDYSLLTNLAAPEKSHLRGNYASSTSLQTDDTDSVSDDTTLSDHMIGQPYQPFSTSSFDCQQSRFLAEGPPPVGPQPPISTKMKPDERRTIGARLEQGFKVHIHRLPVTNQGQHPCTTDLFKISPSTHADSSNSTSQSFVPSPPANVKEEEDLTTPHETIVFVGHANVFRYWLCRALQLPPEAWLRISLYHGSISSLLLTYEPSVWTMAPQTHGHPPVVFSRCVVSSLRIGEIGHLPKELLSR